MTNGLRHRFGRRSGFSLLEMLTVVFIIGLIAGVSVPAFLNFLKTFRLRTAGRQVLGDLNLARQVAISRNRDMYVFFRDNRSYDMIESGFQRGIATGFNAVRFKGPVSIAEHLQLVSVDASKPTGASVTAFPAESLSHIKDQAGADLPDYATTPAAIFRPDGSVGTAGGVWVTLEAGDRGPRYTWMEISANQIGKIATKSGP